MNKPHFLLILTLLLASAAGLPAQEATIQVDKQVFKVYPFSGPDPAPIMMRSSIWGSGPRLYPYFFFDTYSKTGIEQPRKVVRMENPYIKLLILPEEGGKLAAGIEKSTGKDFLYYNHVRKFRNVALRGPWTSGGVELNFGIVGHGPTTATPVDYVVHKNPDGSVSCTVGALDLPSRTCWRVTFTLPPDKAYVETHTLWYNPRPLDQSYYVWMNGANKLTKDLEFIYPGTAFIGHNYAVPERPWPITKDGRNLARFSEHRPGDPGSFFIHGVMADHAGGYWHDSHFGFGHWALYEDVPGQKFFRWQLSRAGEIWENLLTDSDGPYYEPQFGRLLDQNDHEFFAPYAADHWREIWFPYKEIGPIVKATPYGALNARTGKDTVHVGFCALQKIDDELVVHLGGKEILREHLALRPMEVFQKEVPLHGQKGELRVEVGNKLSYTDNPEAGVLHRPLNFRNYTGDTLASLFEQAQRAEKGRNYETALEKYLTCLRREPLFVGALTRVAGLYCRRAEYKKALSYARKALDYVMYDPDANYIYGVISREMGDLLDAKETLGWAARSMKYRSSAYCQIGEIYLMEHNYNRALEYLRRSLDYNAYNVKTYQVLATLYRLRKQPDKARKTLDKILRMDPLNHLAQFEQYLLDPSPAKRSRFQALIQNELPQETYLETAMYYVDLGLEGDALRVLETAPEHPTVRYWQAYLLRDKSPERSRRLLEAAAKLSPHLVFPYRAESVPVFQWAAKTLPENWKSNYYLGLVYWGLRRRGDALAVLEQCGQKPDYAAFYLSRAYLEAGSAPGKALDDYERARSADEKDWRNWYHLATFQSARGLRAEAMETAAEAARRFPKESTINVLLARTSLNNGRFQQCSAALEDITILPSEGQRDVHDLFSNCLIGQALEQMKQSRFAQTVKLLAASKEYPERLGTGQPYRPDYRVQDHLLAICYDKMGLSAKARAARERIGAYVTSPAREKARIEGKQVDRWYSEKLPEKNTFEALRELSTLIRGGGREHH